MKLKHILVHRLSRYATPGQLRYRRKGEKKRVLRSYRKSRHPPEPVSKHNDDVKQLVGISKTPATYQKYEVTRRHLSEFIQRKYNLSDISIEGDNPDNYYRLRVVFANRCQMWSKHPLPSSCSFSNASSDCTQQRNDCRRPVHNYKIRLSVWTEGICRKMN